MLHQQKTRRMAITRPPRRLLAFALGIFDAMRRNRDDSAQLDGLTDRHLEELGLRRTSDSRYRFFD